MHKRTHTLSQQPQLLPCHGPTLWGEKKIWMLTSATCIWPPTSRWVQCFGDTFFLPLLDQTKLPWISQLWVNKRATRLGQIGLMAGLCLPFAVIYSCVYSSCRYSLWSSVPLSFPAPPPGANEETLSCYIRCDTYPPQPCLRLCVLNSVWYRRIAQFLRAE